MATGQMRVRVPPRPPPRPLLLCALRGGSVLGVLGGRGSVARLWLDAGRHAPDVHRRLYRVTFHCNLPKVRNHIAPRVYVSGPTPAPPLHQADGAEHGGEAFGEFRYVIATPAHNEAPYHQRRHRSRDSEPAPAALMSCSLGYLGRLRPAPVQCSHCTTPSTGAQPGNRSSSIRATASTTTAA